MVKCTKCGAEIRYIPHGSDTLIVNAESHELITDSGRIVKGHSRHVCSMRTGEILLKMPKIPEERYRGEILMNASPEELEAFAKTCEEKTYIVTFLNMPIENVGDYSHIDTMPLFKRRVFPERPVWVWPIAIEDQERFMYEYIKRIDGVDWVKPLEEALIKAGREK